jgi:signal transduction histidine kinase
VAQDNYPRLLVAIEDDGPGLPPEAREAVLGRGRRLDETKPGSGLGLSIVADLATLYRGRFRLEQAALGGLRAVLEVPGDAPAGVAHH